MQPIDSYESERLRDMIKRKEDFYKQKQNDGVSEKYLQAMQSEIMFLKNYILPIVLRSTGIEHSEFVRYVTNALGNAVQKDCNGLLIYQPIKEDYVGRPLVGIANLLQKCEYGTPGAIELHIDNMDGCGVKIKPIIIHVD